MHDAIPSRILNGWLRLEEDLFHLQVLSSLPPNSDLLSRVYHISQRKNILIYENLTVLLRTEPRSAKSPMRDTLTVRTWGLIFP